MCEDDIDIVKAKTLERSLCALDDAKHVPKCEDDTKRTIVAVTYCLRESPLSLGP